MAFSANSLLSFCSIENKNEKQPISQSLQPKQAVGNVVFGNPPNRELSSFLLNELRGSDFFQDTYVASKHCIELEYDLDDLISLSKQLQQKHNTVLRDGQPSQTSEGDQKELVRNHQPAVVSPKASVVNEPYSLLGYSVKANTRRSARNVTPVKCKPKHTVSSAAKCSLTTGNGLFSGTPETRPQLWSHIERPMPKKHSCIVLPFQRTVKRSVSNLNKSTDYYRFEKTHPNIKLVRSETLFPKRVAKVLYTASVDLCSSELSAETFKESDLSESVKLADTNQLIKDEDVAVIRNPTWHDVLEHKIEDAPKISETHDKEVQVECVENLKKINSGRREKQKSDSYGSSRAPNVIQILPPLNIRRECRIQKLPDVSLSSANDLITNSNNNAYFEVVYSKRMDHSEHRDLSIDQIQMQPDGISNPYMHHLEQNDAISEDEASAEHNDDELSNKKSNSEEYSTSFEINSSLHDSMTSQPITDDEKVSFAKHSKSLSQDVPHLMESEGPHTDNSQQKLQSMADSQHFQSTTDPLILSMPNSLQLLSPDSQRLQLWNEERHLTDTEYQIHPSKSSTTNGLSKKSKKSTQTTSGSQSLSSKSLKHLKSLESHKLPKKLTVREIQSVAQLTQNELEIDVPSILEATPVISAAFLQIIDQIVESSPEDHIAAAYHPEPPQTETTCTVPTMAFGKSAIFEMVHEDWTIHPDRHQIDTAVQTFPMNERTNFQSSAVQTDPLAEAYHSVDHWDSESIASAHMVFDRIRKDKIEHWQRQSANTAYFMAPIDNGTKATEISASVTKNQSVQYSPPGQVEPVKSEKTEINERPRHLRRRPVSHSLESSSSASVRNHYTPRPSHRQHMSPSERLTSYKEIQQRHVLFQENPKALRTIDSIRNEAAEGNIGHRRSLNSTYRSAYEDDDIEIAAQRFLNSVHKARKSKQSTQTSIDLYRTESSTTQNSSSPKFYSLDGTPSSASASQVTEQYLCTNSEATSLSVNGSPVPRCLSFRSSDNERCMGRSIGSSSGISANNNVSPRNSNRKTYITPKSEAKKTPDASSFEMTTTSSSIENSEEKLRSLAMEEASASLRQNSTSSSIEKQIAKFRLTERSYDHRLSIDLNEFIGQKNSYGCQPPINELTRLTDVQSELKSSLQRSIDPKSSFDYQSSIDFQSSSDQHSSCRHSTTYQSSKSFSSYKFRG